ncbi:MAG: hypothetical protein HY216_08310, partial [Candidatus Rokubacteria bacterium]|nr:hypothetical protein [Candidatus Rokubacteria bacterium]
MTAANGLTTVQRAYVPNMAGSTSANVSVIDVGSASVIETVISSFNQPVSVAVSPDGRRVWVPNQGSNSVYVLDTTTDTLAAAVNLGTGAAPVAVAVSPDGTRAWVSNSGANSVSVIDTASYAVIATIDIGSVPYGIVVSPNGQRVYVVDLTANSVALIDT